MKENSEFLILGCYGMHDSEVREFEDEVSECIRASFQVCTSGERLAKNGQAYIFVHLVRS